MRCTNKTIIVVFSVVYHCRDEFGQEKRNYAYPNASRRLSHNKILLSNDVRSRATIDTRHLVRKRREEKRHTEREREFLCVGVSRLE